MRPADDGGACVDPPNNGGGDPDPPAPDPPTTPPSTPPCQDGNGTVCVYSGPPDDPDPTIPVIYAYIPYDESGGGPSNGWEWDEKPHWPTPQPPHPRQQSFGDCFNGSMKASALPGGSNTQNAITVTTTLSTIWNLLSPNPVSKAISIGSAWYNLSRILPSALVCSDPNAHF